MVVTAVWMMMASAAPAASSEPDRQTNFVCGKPGIFADQATGCQVFHFCQDDGRMDSFFCPNQTLFNQQFFVCDWYYNVDCSIANQFFHLNDALYLYEAEDTLSRAIQPALKISQDEILAGSASQVTSHSATQPAKTQLDAGPAPGQAIVVDGNSPLLTAASQPQTKVTSNDIATDPYNDPSSDPEPAAYYSQAGLYDPLTDPYTDPEPAGYYAGANSVYSDPSSDPEPASYNTPVLTSYSDSANSVYSDPSSDPEPAYFSDPYTDPEPAYFSDPYTDPEPASYTPVLTSYSNDPLTDPEPVYASNSDPYTDPEPPAYYDSSDPEPYAVNYQGYDPEPAAAYQQPVVYSNSKLYDGVLPTYQGGDLLLVDQSDPEPSADPEYTPY